MRTGKRILSVLCALVLLVGTMQPLPAVAAGVPVIEIIIPIVEGLEYLDEDGMLMKKDEPIECETYQYEYRENSFAILPLEGEEALPRKVTFYLEADEKPEIKTDTGSVNVGNTKQSFGWEVGVVTSNSVKESMTLELSAGKKQFNVSYPESVNGKYSITPGETKVEENSSVTFYVEPANPDKEDLIVMANNAPLDKGEHTASGYAYTKQITRDTVITIDTSDKTFSINLPDDTDEYTVTSASQSGGNTATYNGSFSFYVTPMEGVKKPEVLLEGETNGATLKEVSDNLYMITNIKSDLTVDIKSAGKKTVNVTLTPGNNYSFFDEDGEGTALSTVNYGESYRFTVKPADGYEITGVYANGKEVVKAEGNDYYETEPLVADSTTITVLTTEKTYTITTPDLSEGFAFSLNGSNTVSHNGSFSFYVTPAEGYEVPTVTIEGTEGNSETLAGVNNLYTYSGVTENKTIKIISGAKKTLSIEFVESTDGEYTYSEISSKIESTRQVAAVEYNGEVTFKVNPGDGYQITEVSANNRILTSENDGTYRLSDVKENQVVRVTVKKSSYTVKFAQPETKAYNLIEGTSPVEHGGSYSFYVTPEEGFADPVVKDGETTLKSVGNGQYVISNITDHKEITIENGDRLTYTVTFNEGAGYTYQNAEGGNMDSVTTVAYGESLSFKIQLDQDYNQSQPVVSVNSVNMTAKEGLYTIENVRGSQVVAVSGVQKNVYNVTLTKGTGYTLSTTESTKVTAGNTFTFSLTGAEGYDISKAVVKANDSLISEENGYYIITVEADTTITVEEVVPITFNAEADLLHAELQDQNPPEGKNIPYNGSYSFKILPDQGYQVEKVAVNGTVIEAINDVYTINNIVKQPVITAVVTTIPLTVHYVDEKYNFSQDITYTIEDMTEGRVQTLSVEKESQVYAFDGWYRGDERVSELTTEDLGQELTLTAKWLPVFDRLMEIVTSGEEVMDTQDGTEQYVVTYKTLLKFTESLDEEYENSVRITGYGTLYAPNEIDTKNEAIQNAVLNRDQTVQDGIITQNNVAGLQLSNYFRNRDLAPSAIGDETSFGLLKYSANPLDRWGAGWIELTVGDSKLVVYSVAVRVTYDSTVENGTEDSPEAQALRAAMTEEQETSEAPAVEQEVTEASRDMESNGEETVESPVTTEASTEESEISTEEVSESAEETEEAVETQNTESETEPQSTEVSAKTEVVEENSEQTNSTNAMETETDSAFEVSEVN